MSLRPEGKLPLPSTLGIFLICLATIWSTGFAVDPAVVPPGEKLYRIVLTGTDLAGWLVTLKGTDHLLESDAKGVTRSPLDGTTRVHLKPGTFAVELLKGKDRRNVTITAGDLETIEVPLGVAGAARKEEVRKLEAVEVTSGDLIPDRSRQVITTAESRFIPGTAGDILKAVENFPGVVTPGGLFSGLFIRGSDRNDILFLFGRQKIGDPFHNSLLGLYSVFPTASIDRVDFYPGGFPANLGGAQGAVIQVQPKASHEDKKVHFEFDGNLVTSGGYLTVPLGDKWRVSLGGRRTYFEFYLGLLKNIPAAPSFLADFPSIPFFYDYFTEVAFTPDAYNQVTLTAIGKQDSVRLNTDRFPVTDETGKTNLIRFDQEFDDRWFSQGLTWNHQKQNLAWNLTVSHLKSYNEVILFGAPASKTAKETLDGVFDLQHKATPAFTWGAGIEWLWEQEVGTIGVPKAGSETNLNGAAFPSQQAALAAVSRYFSEATPTEIRPSQQQIAPSLRTELTAGPFTLGAGLRLVTTETFKTVELEPRADLKWDILKDLSFFARTGRAAQTPAFLVLVPQRPLTYQPPGNPWPYAWQSSAGFEGKKGDYTLKLEGYYKSLERQTLGNPLFDDAFAEGPNNQRLIGDGTGRSYGMEVFLRKRLSQGLFGWFTYTLSRSERETFVPTNNSYVYLDPANNGRDYANVPRETLAFTEDVTHVARVLVSWQISKAFRIGTRLTVKGGKPYTPKNVLWTDRSNFTVINSGELSFVDSANRLGERTPVAVNWDMRFDLTIPLGKAGELGLYMDLWNIQSLFRPNVLSYSYSQAYLRDASRSDWTDLKNPGDRIPAPAGSITGGGDLPLLPLLGFTVKF